jgi:hypothetical protein
MTRSRSRSPVRNHSNKSNHHNFWWIIPTLVICIISLVSICDESHAPSKESAACQALFSVYAKASTWYSYCVQNPVVTALLVTLSIFVLLKAFSGRKKGEDPFKDGILPDSLEIVTDVLIADPDDQVMIAALMTKLFFSKNKHEIYLRTSLQDKYPEVSEYWTLIIEWIEKFANSVNISVSYDRHGNLTVNKSTIRLIDGNTGCFIDARTKKTGKSVLNDIIVDTTLICGKEGICPFKIKTVGRLIYVGKLDKKWRTVGVNSSKNTDKKIAKLRTLDVKISNLDPELSRVTPSAGFYSDVIQVLGVLQCLLFLTSRCHLFYGCNAELMNRCFPDATPEVLDGYVKKLDGKSQRLINVWTEKVDDDNFTYLIKLACVLYGCWPYVQTDVQDQSFGWGLCWNPADLDGPYNILGLKKEESDGLQILVESINKRATEYFGPGNKLSPTYYDLYGLFLAMDIPANSKQYTNLSKRFARFTCTGV